MSSNKTSAARAVYDEDEGAEVVDAPAEEAADPASTESRPAPSLEGESSRLQQILAVLRGLAPYARRYRRGFASGAFCALLVVGSKLALPWPLRAVADSWSKDAHGGLLHWVPAGIDPVVAMGVLFMLLGFALGLFDMLARLHFARFALSTVKDMRADAMAVAVTQRRQDSGDLVARFVGDSSRVSAGMRNFLVHVGTSVILLLGMTVILFSMAPSLGLIFLGAGFITIIVTTCIARRIFISSLRTRAKESELAGRLFKAMNDDVAEESDNAADFARTRRAKANHTRLQGIATWSAHIIFGAAVLAALWIGSREVAAGQLSPGDMVVFMMYALMLQSPTVKLARQGAKCGKIFGSAARLLQIVQQPSRN